MNAEADSRQGGFTLDHLTPTEFEEFCCDLLRGLKGIVNVDWRKGTGLPASPADSGRDIECEYIREDVDGETHLDKWFIECKHYRQGVPPDAIASALSWATAESPSILVIVVSSFLSNACKNYIEVYKQSQKPRFQIKIWERPELETLTLGRSALLRKYRISEDFPLLGLLHPAHIQYLKGTDIIPMSFLFDALDDLDKDKRDVLLYPLYCRIIDPRTLVTLRAVNPEPPRLIDEVSYDAFKRKLGSIARLQDFDEYLLVQMVLMWVLQHQLHIGDYTAMDEYARRQLEIESLMTDTEVARFGSERFTDAWHAFVKKHTQRVEADVRASYDLYVYFCEHVVGRLLSEAVFTDLD